MKKRNKFNALITAGCLAFLAPISVQANDLGSIEPSASETLNVNSGGDTFNNIQINDGVTYTIDSTSGTLAPNADQGAVTMAGTSAIQFSPAISEITFSSLQAQGSNTITQSSNSAGNSNLGAVSVESGNSLSVTAQGGTVNFSTSSVASGSQLNLNADGGVIEGSGITTLDGGTLNIQGANNVTTNGVNVSGTANITNTNTAGATNLGAVSVTDAVLTVSGIQADDYTSISYTGNNTLNTSDVDLGALTLNDGQTLDVNATGDTEFADVILSQATTGTTNLSLNANGGNINLDSAALNGNNNINISGASSVSIANGVTVVGATNRLNNTSDNTVSLGGINYNDSSASDVALNGNYDIGAVNLTADTGAAVINSSGTSSMGDISEGSRASLEINQTSGALTYGSASLDSNATLSMEAAQNSSISATNALSMSGNNNLSISGDGVVDVVGVNVSGTGNSISNSNTSANFGDIALNGATLSLNGIKEANIDGITFTSNANTLNVDNSDLGNISLTSGQTLNINSSNNASSFSDAVLAAGTSGDPTNLNLSADTANLTGNSITLNGESQIDIQGANGFSTSLTNGMSVSGSNNILNNDSDSNMSINGATVFADGGTSDLSINANNAAFSFNGITAGGNDVVNSNGNNSLGSLAASGGDTLTINATGTAATTDFSGGNISGATLTLNADGASIEGTAVTTLADGSSLNLTGSSSVNLTGGISASGTGNTVTNSTANNSLGAIDIVSDGDFTVNATADTTYTNATLTQGTNGNTQLVLNANGGDISGTSISMNGNSILETSGTNTITNGTISIDGISNVINNSNANTSLGILDLDTGTGELEVNANANTSYQTANIANGSSLTLNAATGTITGTSAVSMSGNASFDVDGTQSIDVVGVNVTGTGNSITNNNNNAADFATIALNDATLSIDGIAEANRDEFSFSGDNTLNSRNSDIGAINLDAAGDSLVLNSVTNGTSENNNTAFSTATLADGASLTLNADAETGSIDATSISMNGNNSLSVSGTGNVNIDGITVTGAGNEIVNTNTSATSNLGTIQLTDAVLNVSGLNSSNYDSFTYNGVSNTINSTNSELGEISVSSAQTLNVNAEGTTSFTNATLAGGTGTDQMTTLNLNANNGTISGNSIDMNSYNNVNITGTQQVGITGGISVTGSQNNLTSTNDNSVLVAGPLTFDGTNNSLNINGDFTIGGVSTSGTDRINSSGDILLGDITVGADDALTIQSTSGNTAFANTQINTGSTLTLNANGGSLSSTADTSISGNTSLILAGDNVIDLAGVSISGADNSLTVSNTNANTSLGNLTLGTTGIDTSVTTQNGSIDNINVDNLVINTDNTPTWTLEANATTGTADNINIAEGGSATGKLNFSIGSLINEPTEKFVHYIKLVDSDDYILNTTGTGTDRNILQILTTSTYYSYVDGSTPVANNDYAANTIRLTNYNIDSDALLDYLTRQGEREYTITAGTQYIANTGILALPNLEAREGINNEFTLKGTGVLDGRDSNVGTINAQMFTLDTTADNIERTLNLDGFTYTNARSTSADGNGSVIITNSTDANATVNLASYTSGGVTTQPTFVNNASTNNGGVIYNSGEASTINATADTDIIFESNIAGVNGGAIHNTNGAEINFAGNTTFNSNIAAAGDGGAIYNNEAKLALGGIDKTTVFNSNRAAGSGGAIYSDDNDLDIVGDVVYNDNSANENGGAIAAINTTVNMSGTQTFTNNSASGKGGAIYANGTETNPTVINIASTRAGSSTVFSGNTAAGESNAIYLESNSTLNLSAVDGANIVFDDGIAGTSDNNKIVQQNGSVYYNNDNSGYAGNFELLGGDAYFTSPNSKAFMGGDYTLAGGSTLHLDNGTTDVIYANSLDLANTSLSNPANMTIDMNLSTELSDRFALASSTSGNILVTGINATGDTNEDRIFFNIAEGADFDSTVKTVDARFYQYNITGQRSGLLLTKGKLADTALQAPQVAVSARLAAQLDMFNQLLHRVDEIAEYRYFNKVDRNNLYASAHDVIDNKYTPYVNQEDGGNAWMKPSVTIETISPDGQDGFKNRSYNTILGYETPVATLRNGWELINTVFGGYQGSFQDYDNVNNYQNGGVGGYMANLYKKNFFAGGVVMMGGTGVQTKDNGIHNRSMSFGLFDIGAAARLGYNVGLGKHWLFQPMFTTSYIYISGINKSNDQGEDMHLDGTNTIQIAPGFKLVGNYGGWQPYVLFDYTWPLIAKTVANVNDIDLPDVGLRSYVEYGVGLRKNVGERFTGYAEAVLRNGGRTGISFQGGLVYKF